ncbi:MAG TPA: outer membrane beta-barrel protein [Pedomonas sp.]|uniref:outer membrane protein n=1 Tax=Pedomonas sp. TaxID=2976421 RepID=UPI002F3E4F6F
MKKALVASLVAMTVATPALAADFTGFRVAGTVGLADENFLGDDAFTYGVNVGYDRAYGNLIAGVTAEFQESGETGYGRDLSVAARLGTKVTDTAMVYGLVGYTNQGTEGYAGKLDGVRLGLGAEVAFNEQLFANVEYRYSNYERGAELHQTLVGLGVRF